MNTRSQSPTRRRHPTPTVTAFAVLLSVAAGCTNGSDGDTLSPTEGVAATAPATTEVAPVAAEPTATTEVGAAIEASTESATETSVAGLGGNPSKEGAFDYVIEPGDFPVQLAEKFALASWRDIFAVNGWVSEDQFPLPGTVILMPAGNADEVTGESGTSSGT
jgi:hypothetical protein